MEKDVRILVVDDQPEMAGALTSFVRLLGYTASAVSSGGDALTRICQDPPSLVLLDLNLADASGGEVLRALRGDLRYASLPVVICTAEERLSAADVRRLGAQDFVEKGEVFERLGGVIARQLDHPKSTEKPL